MTVICFDVANIFSFYLACMYFIRERSVRQAVNNYFFSGVFNIKEQRSYIILPRLTDRNYFFIVIGLYSMDVDIS